MTESERRVIEAAKRVAETWGQPESVVSFHIESLRHDLAALEAEPERPDVAFDMTGKEWADLDAHPVPTPKNPETVSVELSREVADDMLTAVAGGDANWSSMDVFADACRRALADTPPVDDGVQATYLGFNVEADPSIPPGMFELRPTAEPAPVEGGGPYTVEKVERGFLMSGPGLPEHERFFARAGLCRIVQKARNAAYSQGFTAGQKGRSDCGEVAAVIASIDAQLNVKRPLPCDTPYDEGYDKGVTETLKSIRAKLVATPASRGEGEPQGESQFTPDEQAEIRTGSVRGFGVGDVIGRKRLDTLRECEIAATAFGQGVSEAEKVAQPAALQNTPEPDESEAVKLLRELAELAQTAFPDSVGVKEEQVTQARGELIRRLYEIPLPEILTASTPEVDNAE